MRNKTKISKFILTSLVVFGGGALAAACAHKPEAPEGVQAATPSAPAVQKVEATLQPAAKSKVKGTVSFTTEADGVRLIANIEGLKKNSSHGFHVHAVGDCSGKGFTTAGDHWNPTNTPHGAHEGDARHVGDLGNIKADKNGKAEINMIVPGLSERFSEVAGKAVIVHAKADDLKSQPSGNSGDRIACGVLAPATN